MWSIALVYGTISGVIAISSIVLSITIGGVNSSMGAQWLGYLIMLLALSLVFFGTKRYRDRERGGVIRFAQALWVGLAISVIASIAYVIIWEIYLAATDYSFTAEFTKSLEEQRIVEGIIDEALDAEITRMAAAEAMMTNPLFRIPITFTEIFPVGAIVALVSAALLRNPKFTPNRD